ncbi:hypothetical protein [Neobacillus drentensis]|uniref:hypothetical protein n=1 Tax=Neobacillus drentensis TaxID=220684 RepID=UPI002FFF44C9
MINVVNFIAVAIVAILVMVGLGVVATKITFLSKYKQRHWDIWIVSMLSDDIHKVSYVI